MLFSLGQHKALVAVQARLQADEKLFAYLDDVHTVCTPANVEDVHTIMKEATHCLGPGSQTWSHCVERRSRFASRSPRSPSVGSPECVIRPLDAKSTEHAVLLDRIPAVADVEACEIQFEDGETTAGAAL